MSAFSLLSMPETDDRWLFPYVLRLGQYTISMME